MPSVPHVLPESLEPPEDDEVAPPRAPHDPSGVVALVIGLVSAAAVLFIVWRVVSTAMVPPP
jgi:hypothetical protein